MVIPDRIFTQLDYIAGSTIIRFTETDPALLQVDVVVEEQDTNLILGKSPVIMDTIGAMLEHKGEVRLGRIQSLRGGTAVPFDSGGVVLGHTLTIFVHESEAVLSLSQPLLG